MYELTDLVLKSSAYP